MARRLTQDEFIDRCKGIYDNEFDFTNTVYKNKRSDVEFVCRIHGVVSQNAERLSNGNGCPKCNIRDKKTTEDTRFTILEIVF
jgi:hypothetical protein